MYKDSKGFHKGDEDGEGVVRYVGFGGGGIPASVETSTSRMWTFSSAINKHSRITCGWNLTWTAACRGDAADCHRRWSHHVTLRLATRNGKCHNSKGQILSSLIREMWSNKRIILGPPGFIRTEEEQQQLITFGQLTYTNYLNTLDISEDKQKTFNTVKYLPLKAKHYCTHFRANSLVIFGNVCRACLR